MSKILIIQLQPIVNKNINDLICYYDSRNKELLECGNDVMWLNTIKSIQISKKGKKRWINSWIKQIEDFKPDIIFAFNNQIFEEIINVTNCPIVIVEADLLNFFVNIDFIKKYSERYYLVTFYDKFISDYKKLGFKKDRIILLHPATSVQNKPSNKINNISFIGSAFQNVMHYTKKELIKDNNGKLYSMFREHWNNHNYDYDDLCKKYFPKNYLNIIDYYSIFDCRIYILQSILDLGLKLYGVNWDKMPSQLLPLLSAFDPTPIYSLHQNQDLYNSSIVNINISHPQCQGYAFPWRVYDIMASSGVLVSSYASALENYTKGFVDIPMFKSPYDARELCKKMLKEDNLRNDIINASNEFIDKFGRWKDNFLKIQDYTKINILSDKHKGQDYYIEYDFDKENIYSHSKILFKTITNGFLYSLYCIPVIKKLMKTKNLYKLYNSMLKYDKDLRNTINDIL